SLSSASFAWGDVDHSGRLDLIVDGIDAGNQQNRLLLFLNQGGSLSAPLEPLSGSNFLGCPALGDIDGDTDIDLMVSGDSNGAAQTLFLKNGVERVSGSANNPPAQISATTSDLIGSDLIVRWNAPSDDHTPSNALFY